jgi:ATP-dependent Clp protease ATP-binding subunit ClpB
MEIDSKPEVMDKLDRRMIQLKIEREAVRKERDEASKKRMHLIEEELLKLEREYNDLDEIWKAEKAQVQGSAQIKEEIDKLKLELAICSARTSGTRWPKSSTASCRSSRRN